MHPPFRYYWQQIKDAVFSLVIWKPTILPAEEVVTYLLEHRASLARFGDGELKVLNGFDINFQPSNPLLQQRLREVSEAKDIALLIGIPDIFEHLERYCAFDQKFWRYHLCWNRKRWYSLLSPERNYASTFLSRFYSIDFDRTKAAERIGVVRQLWKGRDIMIVEGKDSKIGVGNDLFSSALSIRRILCPSKDAFACYDAILAAIQKTVLRSDLIILALGPTATVLSFDLCRAGYQALDLGHIDLEYEWFLMGATEKVAVTGKFSNEAFLEKKAVSEVSGQLFDEDYNRQILCIIEP